MPKDVDAGLIPYFYKKNSAVLTAYEMNLTDDNATYETKYVANNVDVGQYQALAIKRGTITSEDGTILNELDIGLDNTSLEFKQWVLSGYLERKKVKILLMFVNPVNGWELGSVILFHGIMDAPKGDENWVSITCRPFSMLDREFPRRIYQTGCNWQFGSLSDCKIQMDNYDFNGTLSAESDGTTLTIAHGQAANYFVPGYAEITDGTYIGEVRPVALNGTGDVIVRVSFGHTIPSGTGIKLQKLCAKNPITCQDDFSNYDNYGGFPHVPKQPII